MADDYTAIYLGSERLPAEPIDCAAFLNLPQAGAAAAPIDRRDSRAFAGALPFLPGWQIVKLVTPIASPPLLRETFISDGSTRWSAQDPGSWARITAGHPQVTAATALAYASLYLFCVQPGWRVAPARGRYDHAPITKDGRPLSDYNEVRPVLEGFEVTLDVIESPILQAKHERIMLQIFPATGAIQELRREQFRPADRIPAMR